MFSCELKLNCDILKKWFSKQFTRRFLELNTFSKNIWEKQNPIEWWGCCICDFELVVGFDSEKMTYFDFIVKTEHALLRKIYEKEELDECKAIKNIETYYFQKFIQISLLINDFYSRKRYTKDIPHDCVSLFF